MYYALDSCRVLSGCVCGPRGRRARSSGRRGLVEAAAVTRRRSAALWLPYDGPQRSQGATPSPALKPDLSAPREQADLVTPFRERGPDRALEAVGGEVGRPDIALGGEAMPPRAPIKQSKAKNDQARFLRLSWLFKNAVFARYEPNTCPTEV